MARNIEMAVNLHTSKKVLRNNFPDNHVPECHRVNILYWNIRRITDKLQNKQLCEYICQHDIVFSSYTGYNFARQVRHKKAKCCSSGVPILVANRLNNHIEIKRVNECLVWITYSSDNTNTKKKE